MRWASRGRSAAGFSSWTRARSSRRRRLRPSSPNRPPSAPRVSSPNSKTETSTEGSDHEDQPADALAARCCHAARLGAVDADRKPGPGDSVASDRGDEIEEAEGLPVPAILFDLLPQPENRSD